MLDRPESVYMADEYKKQMTFFEFAIKTIAGLVMITVPVLAVIGVYVLFGVIA